MPALPTSVTALCSASSGPTNRSLPSRYTIALLLSSLAPAVAAQTSPGTFEITPYGGYRFGGTFEDDDTGARAELDDNTSAGLILNLRESSNTQWELIYARQSTVADVGDFELPAATLDIDLESVELGGTYLGGGDRWRPFMSATIGATYMSPALNDLDSDTFWSFSVGAGAQIAAASRVGLRIEGRLRGILLDADSDLFCSSGPAGGLCAIALSGDVLWQFETFAGLVFRF